MNSSNKDTYTIRDMNSEIDKILRIASENNVGYGRYKMSKEFIDAARRIKAKSVMLGVKYREKIWKQGMTEGQYKAGVDGIGNIINYVIKSFEYINSCEYRLKMSFKGFGGEITGGLEESFINRDDSDVGNTVYGEDSVVVEANVYENGDKQVFYSRGDIELCYELDDESYKFNANCYDLLETVSVIIGLEIERREQIRRGVSVDDIIIRKYEIDRIELLVTRVLKETYKVPENKRISDNDEKSKIKRMILVAYYDDNSLYNEEAWIKRYLEHRHLRIGNLY